METNRLRRFIEFGQKWLRWWSVAIKRDLTGNCLFGKQTIIQHLSYLLILFIFK